MTVTTIRAAGTALTVGELREAMTGLADHDPVFVSSSPSEGPALSAQQSGGRLDIGTGVDIENCSGCRARW